MPAYGYLRKSSVHDPTRELSYEVQEQAVREMAKRHGDNHGSLVLLSDWDKSGRLGADKRPGYRALLEAIESGRASSIYSYSLSRLARSVQELSRLIADCDRRGIPVRLYADHVDTTTASGKLLTNVLSSVAQFEADVTSERIRAANAAKSARGERVGTVRFYGDGDGDDADAVLAAFGEAGSYSGAARLLNERHVKPRSAKPRRVKRQDGTENNQEQAVWWPSSVAVVVRRLDPSIAALRATRGYAAGGTDFALARLLRCPTCGTTLTGTRDRGRSRVRYSCRLGSVTPHERVSVSEHLILPAIQAEAEHLMTPKQIEAVTMDGPKRATLDAKRTRIVDMFADGTIDKAERDRRLGEVHDAMSKLDAQRVIMAVPRVQWTWRPRNLNAALRAIFDSIVLDPATFQPIAFQWAVREWRAD